MAATPQFLIVGGINGAGKSTLAARMMVRPAFSGIPVLNPDLATRALHVGNVSLATANFAALRQIEIALRGHLALRQTVIAETVLANAAYRRHAREAMRAGYDVRLIYVALRTVEDAIARVADRVARGGHDVPEADIRRRWPKTHANLGWFAQHVSAVGVFDNTAPDGEARFVAEARQGVVTIFDEDALPAVTAVLRPLVKSP